MTDTTPTLVELINKCIAESLQGIDGGGSQLLKIRDAAEALEGEYAKATAELCTKAAEYLQVFRAMEELQEQYDLESKEADAYARKMHASDDMVVAIATAFGIDEFVGAPGFQEILDRVAARPPARAAKPPVVKALSTEVSSLVELGT